MMVKDCGTCIDRTAVMGSAKWIIFAAGWVHLIWAALLFTTGMDIKEITPLSEATKSLGVPATGILMVFAGVLAIIESMWPRRNRSHGFAMILPQQFLLFMSMVGAVYASINGIYPDGYSPAVSKPGLFILSDQALMITVTLAHFGAIFQTYIGDLLIWKSRRSSV